MNKLICTRRLTILERKYKQKLNLCCAIAIGAKSSDLQLFISFFCIHPISYFCARHFRLTYFYTFLFCIFEQFKFMIHDAFYNVIKTYELLSNKYMCKFENNWTKCYSRQLYNTSSDTYNVRKLRLYAIDSGKCIQYANHLLFEYILQCESAIKYFFVGIVSSLIKLFIKNSNE